MGPRGYTAAVLWELARMRNVPTRLTLDGTEETVSTCMVAVCNSVHTGGAMKMAPLARPDDGWFDVLLCESMGRFELAGVFPRIFDGSHVRHPKVRMTRAKHVRIEPERPSPLLLDGEVLGSTPIDIQILPGALRVLL
jgi:diacylglycerol kinase (ATP)